LSWICDIAELIRWEKNIGWDDLKICAKQLRCEKVLNLGLILVPRLWQMETPSSGQLSWLRSSGLYSNFAQILFMR
jgi:hypothetical protein